MLKRKGGGVELTVEREEREYGFLGRRDLRFGSCVVGSFLVLLTAKEINKRV